jgi:membrane fusion protein, multidrug efflux system
MSPRPIPAAAGAALLVLLAACGKAADPAKPAAAPPPLEVSTAKAATRKVPISIEAVGQAEGSREVEIRARVSGILEKRLYTEGAPVTAGATLFVIDPAPYELAVQRARAALQQERVRKELAEVEAKRLAPLVEEKAIARREADQALAAAKTATAAIASAESSLREAELNLSYTKVEAPISGITGRAVRSEGSLVSAGTESSLLTTMTQVDPIWVRFSLAESDFERVRGNQRQARVQLIAADGTVALDNGRLNFAGSTVDAKLGAVQLRAEFPNAAQKWLPGQFLKVRLLAGEQDAILVPQSALLQSEQSRIVMTVGVDGKAVPKPVKTSGWIGSDAVITGGLAEGDAVILDNLVKVRPGTAVSPRSTSQGPEVKVAPAK